MKLSIKKSDVINATGLSGYRLFSHQRRKIFLLELILKTFSESITILDVGCASGDISVELSILGFQVHGIDFEPKRLFVAKELAQKYCQEILFENKSFEELRGSKTYDIVLLGEVLEHFRDPVKMLGDIKSLLNPGGSVVITTPNMPSLRSRLKFAIFGIFPDNNPEHKYYFDYTRFSQVVKESGYIISYIKTKFTNVFCLSEFVSYIESVLLFWFTLLSPKSGDTLIAIIYPKRSRSSI